MSWFTNKVWTWSWPFSWTGYKQVKLILTRLESNDHGVFGHLTTDNGFDCLTLERHDIDIANGVYQIKLYNSPHFKMLVPQLQNVPGRTSIEIHPGNVELDSKGCILVGTSRAGVAILESRKAFSGLMAALQGADDIWLTIR